MQSICFIVVRRYIPKSSESLAKGEQRITDIKTSDLFKSKRLIFGIIIEFATQMILTFEEPVLPNRVTEYYDLPEAAVGK
jgi:hypothetical protein